jgi:hypothetical protein
MVTAEANSPAVFARGFKWLVGADRSAPQWAEGLLPHAQGPHGHGAVPRLETVAVIQENTPHTWTWGGGAVNRPGWPA